MGCLRSDGRERLLASWVANSVDAAAVVGTYAALAIHFSYVSGHVEYDASEVNLFNLQTGKPPSPTLALGGRVDCPSAGSCGIDQLVLGSDAVSAVHTTEEGFDANGAVCSCIVEKIVASDRTGTNNTLDSATEPDGSPTVLTNLTLSGDTLTWKDNGELRSGQLQP
jgi:hypothetical protein